MSIPHLFNVLSFDLTCLKGEHLKSEDLYPGCTQLLIMTVEQLFKSQEGYLPCLAILLKNLQFQKYIVCIIVNEAPNIYMAGLLHYGLDTFHLAWGCLDKLKACLHWCVQWTFLSATFPPHIHMMIKDKLLRPGYSAIYITSNQPNTTYVMHKVVNDIEDMWQNYECFLSSPFTLDPQPCMSIFVDKKELACHIFTHLDSCLPPEHCDMGIVMH